MAFPVIAINSSGSDAAASGAGPAVALSGAAAATATSAVVTLLTDNPDLSGVAVDGSAAIWVASSSGRRWARITAVNNTAGVKTVTCSESFANTESGKSWGIGGKRLSLDGSTQLGLDVRGGWAIDLQTDMTNTVNFRLTPNAVAGSPFTIKSTVGTRATKIQTATNSILGLDLMGANNTIVQNLYLKCTAATPGDGLGLSTFTASCINLIVRQCILDGWQNGIRMGDSGVNVRMQSLLVQQCGIKNCTQNAIWNAGSGGPHLVDCYLHDNGSASSGSTVYPTLGQGATTGFWQGGGISCRRCVFANNYGPAMNFAAVDVAGSSALTAAVTFADCVFYKNNRLGGATAGVMGDLRISATGGSSIYTENCIFYGSAAGNFAVQVASGSATLFVADNCAFGVYTVNTSGTGVSTGTNPITLTGDPFTSGTDFKLNGTAGAGAACTSAGLQGIPNATAASDTPVVEHIQTQAAAGVSTDPGIANVKSGTTYTINGAALTGTLAAGGGSMTIARTTGALLGTDETTGVTLTGDGAVTTGTEADLLGDNASAGYVWLYAVATLAAGKQATLRVNLTSCRLAAQTYTGDASIRLVVNVLGAAGAQKFFLGRFPISRYAIARASNNSPDVTSLTNVAVLYELEKFS